jgi:hypothetical protein
LRFICGGGTSIDAKTNCGNYGYVPNKFHKESFKLKQPRLDVAALIVIGLV